MMPLIKRFEHLQIQLEAIKSATDNFGDDTRIGKGGFGNVYKGELTHSRGRTIVAIKRLNRAFGQGDPEFLKEIIMLSLYRHENLVSLLGFCDDSGEKILVYEYASRRSLDLYLNSNDLSWVRRLEVCIGAARGLAYLHSSAGTQQRVLHRDIKSSNILLDENWNARISDFGLSKFGPANQQYTFLVSNTVGTIGYCDPLYVETGLLTKESDVYSFGVVLFEVLCGRLCIGNEHDKRRPLTALVRQFYKENKIIEIVYNNIKDEINPNSLKAFTTIAHRCLSRDREARPSMTEVLSALESALDYQSGSTPSLIKAEVPWSARRGSFSEKDRVLKTVRGILNKLTPEKFDVLERQLLLSSGIRTTDIFKGVISLIFDKAILEPIFCPVYARLCSNLSMKLPPFPSDEPGGKDIMFKQMLLNNCQDVFEGAKMREEIRQMASIEQESERRDKERIIKLLKLGNIIFISELKKWRVVPKKIVHHIIQELLGPDLDVKICPAEDNIEAICLVFRTIGKQLDDNQNSRQRNDFYFVLLKELSTNQQLTPRVRFMVLDVIDLRSNKWVPRRKEFTPKIII